MFENLSERLSGVFDRLTKQGALSEDDVKTALREVRVALSRSGRFAPRGPRLRQSGAGKGHRPGRHQIGHPRPAGRQDRARRA